MSSSQLLTFAALVFLAWVLSGKFRSPARITGAQARELLQKGAQLIDVRSAGEYASGHLPGAQNRSAAQLLDSLKSEEEKGRPLIVYCASGMRSASAASRLKKAGFTQIFDLGPMSSW